MRFSIIMAFALLVVSACTRPSNQTAKTERQTLEFGTLGALSTDGLDKMSLEPFVRLANEEVCPCDCPKTFAACLQTGSKCQAALILGQWVVDRVKEGVPFDLMSEALSQEVGSGFASGPSIIDIGGYASKGAKTPTITLVEFADFQCVHCRSTSEVLSKLVKKYPNKIKVVFKHFPLTATHPMARQAAIATEAAARQGKFWQMHDALFASEQILNDEIIDSLAKKIGLTGKKFTQFKADLTDPVVATKVDDSLAEGNRLGIKGTPALFFNGRQYFLSLDESGLELRLKMEDARSHSGC